MVVYHARVRVNSVTSIHWTIHFLLLRSRNIEHVVTHGMLLILEFWLCSSLLLVLSLCLRSNSLSISCTICTNEFLHLRVISDLDSIYIEFFCPGSPLFSFNYLVNRCRTKGISRINWDDGRIQKKINSLLFISACYMNAHLVIWSFVDFMSSWNKSSSTHNIKDAYIHYKGLAIFKQQP